uniref:Uncharacterized protein n=1 Tax=Plectus sambesii TaxID=2011161 RepID=A0A914W008_9BILA
MFLMGYDDRRSPPCCNTVAIKSILIYDGVNKRSKSASRNPLPVCATNEGVNGDVSLSPGLVLNIATDACGAQAFVPAKSRPLLCPSHSVSFLHHRLLFGCVCESPASGSMPRPNIFQDVRDTVDEQTRVWPSSPYVGYSSAHPLSTFRDAVETAFNPVQRLWRSASSSTSATRYEVESNLGSLRHSRSYSSLAPSLGMKQRDRSADRYVSSLKSYEPKGREWRHEVADVRRQRSLSREIKAYRPPLALNERLRFEPSKPSFEYRHAIESTRYLTDCRRAFYTPVTPPRHENYASYVQGRLRGVDMYAPFLARNAQEEDRRYSRYYSSVKTKSMDVYGYLRKANGTYYDASKRVLLAY